MRKICVAVIFFMTTVKSIAQDTSTTKTTDLDISAGTFSTLNEKGKLEVNPAISGYFGDYYFENRYNYETANSASLNIGKRVFRRIKHAEIIPMMGLVFGSFKGATTELQTNLDFKRWTLSSDNQLSVEYTQIDKSLFYNWSVARYKITKNFRFGVTTFLDKHVNKPTIFDKGLTAAILFKQWVVRMYAFNYAIEKRYYWFGVRYNMKVRIARRVKE